MRNHPTCLPCGAERVVRRSSDMRDRKQPFKGLESGYHAAETTVVVQSFVPSDSGYYSERFDLLKVCLASIVAHTDSEYDLMVIDNGSAPIVTKYLNELQRQGVIQYLVLNWRNLGLGGSLNIALNAAPGKYIAFSNDDVFYYPNWLSAHIRILETFPEAGLVSGLLISGPDRQDESILALADDETHVSEFYLPEEWIESFARSIRLTVAQTRTLSNDEDTKLLRGRPDSLIYSEKKFCPRLAVSRSKPGYSLGMVWTESLQWR